MTITGPNDSFGPLVVSFLFYLFIITLLIFAYTILGYIYGYRHQLGIHWQPTQPAPTGRHIATLTGVEGMEMGGGSRRRDRRGRWVGARDASRVPGTFFVGYRNYVTRMAASQGRNYNYRESVCSPKGNYNYIDWRGITMGKVIITADQTVYSFDMAHVCFPAKAYHTKWHPTCN